MKILSCLLSVFVLAQGLKIKDGAYEDLVIQVGEDVPAEQCKEILGNLEATLSESSQYLFSALDGRAYIRSITILLPSSWPDSCTPTLPLASEGLPADITLVTQGQPAWTQQSSGCGRPGDHIFVNYKELEDVDNVEKLGRMVVKEFAKYRYGVFDEQGYKDDPVYPRCYEDKEVKVTGCSDLPIKDDGICAMEGNSSYTVDPKARTSIMFDPSASSVSMFCDEGNHDRYAPTKHNFMCDRRSTLDVILQHPDFLTAQGGQTAQLKGQITNTTPSISYRRRLLTRYVLVIEDSQEMLVRESWTYLRTAIRKWASYDLQDNTEVALIVVNESSATVMLQPTPLTTSRDVVVSNIPFTPGDSRAPPCLHCAIRESVGILKNSTISRGPASSVIVVIATGMDNANAELAMEESRKASEAGIRIATVNYPAVVRSSPLDRLAGITGGPAFTVHEKKQNVDSSLLTTYFQLTNVMYGIAAKFYEGDNRKMPVEIHRRELTDDGRNSITGSFVLDESMGEPARFSIFTHNVDSPLIRSVVLWSPSQQNYTQRKESLLFVKVIILAANISEPGTWTYRIERWAGNPQPHFVQVMATPKSRGVVRAELKSAKIGGALALYTDVKKDMLPVLGARVEVQALRVEANGSISYREKFELLDTGSGDPDITKGDGVYTRYFSPSAGGPGIYTFEVTVTDNGNTAYSSQEGPTGEPCCGSKTPTAKVEPLSPFLRVLPPLTVEITAEDIQLAAQSSVGRVGDLRARVFPQEQRARLTWTSPDMGGLNAARYEVRYARSVQDIADKYETAAELWEIGQPFPLAAGSEITFTLNFTTPETASLLDQPLYFAIKAYSQLSHDSQGGRVSNWVKVVVPKPLPPPTVAPTYSTVDYTSWPHPDQGSVSVDSVVPGIARGNDLGVQLVLPIVVGVVLLLLFLTAYCYFCVAKKRGRDAAKKPVNTSKADKLQSAITIVPSSPVRESTPPPNNQDMHNHAYTNDLHTVGVPLSYQFDDEPKKRYSLVQQQEQQLIEELKQQQQQQQHGIYGGMNVSVISAGGTLQRGGRTLSPYESWTASQLLHEHERRHSPMDEMMHDHQQQELIAAHQQQQELIAAHQQQQQELLQQQQHMEHYNVMVPPPVPPLPSYNGYPVNYSIYGVHQQQMPPMYHQQPPPPFTASLQGSMSSVSSADKKKRNVTMV